MRGCEKILYSRAGHKLQFGVYAYTPDTWGYKYTLRICRSSIEMWWHTVTHGRGSEGENWRMEWVASTLHTTSEHGVSSIITAHAHTSAASNRLNWLPRRFTWTRPFRWKTKSGFCACAITFQTQSTIYCFPTAPMFARTRLTVTLYVHDLAKGPNQAT